MAASVEIFDQALKVRLEKMIAANNDASRLTAAWAADLVEGVEEIFKAEGIPRWAALSKITLERRRKGKGSGKDKILQNEGVLANSVQPQSGPNFGQATTIDERARTLHYGAKQGQFGRSRLANKYGPSKGGPLPWGNIPPRPFMVIQEHTKATIVARGLKWVSGNGL